MGLLNFKINLSSMSYFLVDRSELQSTKSFFRVVTKKKRIRLICQNSYFPTYPKRNPSQNTGISQQLPASSQGNNVPNFENENWRLFGGLNPPAYMRTKYGYDYLMNLLRYSVLTGTLLGDGCIQKTGSIELEQSLRRKEKLEYMKFYLKAIHPVCQSFLPFQVRRRTSGGNLYPYVKIKTFRFFEPWLNYLYASSNFDLRQPEVQEQAARYWMENSIRWGVTDVTDYATVRKEVSDSFKKQIQGDSPNIPLENRRKVITPIWKTIIRNNLQLAIWIMEDGGVMQSLNPQNLSATETRDTDLALGNVYGNSGFVLQDIIRENYLLNSYLTARRYDDRRLAIKYLDPNCPPNQNTMKNQSRFFSLVSPFLVDGFSRKVIPPTFFGRPFNLTNAKGLAVDLNGQPLVEFDLSQEDKDQTESIFHVEEIYEELSQCYNLDGDLDLDEVKRRSVQTKIEQKLTQYGK